MKHIHSRKNEHFKALRKLCLSGHERRKTGHIVLDGMHLIESYIDKFGLPEEIVVCESGLEHYEIAHFLKNAGSGNTVSVLSDDLFGTLASVVTPSGILALVQQPQNACALDWDKDTVLLDGIQDPGNVGSILRSSAAAGFRQILLSEDCAQVWSPKTLRAAMGAHFHLDIHEDSDLSTFLEEYRGLAILTALDATDSLYSLRLQNPVAWVLGNEGQGVRPDVAAVVRQKIRIPMPGAVESLNVAAAAAICLFEAVRQRQ